MKRWLVPLDRSTEAECVVPLVKQAAHDASVRLLHVAPTPSHVEAGGRVIDTSVEIL